MAVLMELYMLLGVPEGKIRCKCNLLMKFYTEEAKALPYSKEI